MLHNPILVEKVVKEKIQEFLRQADLMRQVNQANHQVATQVVTVQAKNFKQVREVS